MYTASCILRQKNKSPIMSSTNHPDLVFVLYITIVCTLHTDHVNCAILYTHTQAVIYISSKTIF